MRQNKALRRTRDANILIGVSWLFAALLVLVVGLSDESGPRAREGDYFLARKKAPPVKVALAACVALTLPVVVALGITGHIKMAHVRRESRMAKEPRRCWNCDYILVTETLARCPECGTIPDAKRERRKALTNETLKEWLRMALATLALVIVLVAMAWTPSFRLSPAVYLSISFGVWWYVHRTSLTLIP
jgi:predicted Zn-ribbon and HTH transcriptional regulator